jgi:hypothetical protein
MMPNPVRDYFVKMQSSNSCCCSVIDFDDELWLRNFLGWCKKDNNVCRLSWSHIFQHNILGISQKKNTTYLVDKYDIPFACFVGLNNHNNLCCYMMCFIIKSRYSKNCLVISSMADMYVKSSTKSYCNVSTKINLEYCVFSRCSV